MEWSDFLNKHRLSIEKSEELLELPTTAIKHTERWPSTYSPSLAYKMALILSPATDYFDYFKKYCSPKPIDTWPTTDFEEVFGVSKTSIEDIALGRRNKSLTQKAAGKISKYSELMWQHANQFNPAHPLALKRPINYKEDFFDNGRPKMLGELALQNFAIDVLGIESDDDINLALDRYRNTKPKGGCGKFLSPEQATDFYGMSEGVYAIIHPSTKYLRSNNNSRRENGFSLSALRISHILPESAKDADAATVRVKLNMPNYYEEDYRGRYQYRGSVIPTNYDLCWSFELYQVVPTLDQEDLWQDRKANSNFKLPVQDKVDLQFHAPDVESEISSFISSLSQRPTSGARNHSRHPYFALSIARRLFNGATTKAQTLFMQKALGYYQSPENLAVHLKELYRAENETLPNEVIDNLKKAAKRYQSLITETQSEIVFAPDI
ncbi:MAG: hypothetical protein AAF542_19330 [Pseudomonadota bacterium]